MNERGGFYVEALCVVAIVAVLATAVAPRIAERGDIGLEQAALELAADLRWLRQKSMNAPRGHEAFPQIKTGVPQLRTDYTGYYIYQGGRQFKTCKFADGVTVGAYNPIAFNADGLANQMVSVHLYKSGRSRSVVVDRVGRIRIE